MSNKPEIVNYKQVIYLTNNDNSDDFKKLFNNKILQQQIKLVVDDIPEKNLSFRKQIDRDIEVFVMVVSSIGLATGVSFGLALIPFGSAIISSLIVSLGAGMLANHVGDLWEKKNNIADPNRDLPDNNYINLLEQLEQNFQIVSYSSVSGTLTFPPGHPMPNKLYRQHPLPDKKNYYMPYEDYYKTLLEEKEVELMNILHDLGVKKIEIHEEKNALNTTVFEAEVKITNAAGTEATISKENESSQLNKLESTYIGKPWHSNLKDEFNASKYRWLPYEPTWESIVHGRLTNGQLTAKIELTTPLSKEEMIGINLGISVEKVFLEKLGLNTSFLDSDSITKNRIFYIEFPGKE
ncbi:MAG: hypothetical protein ACRCU2_18180 [Planktothrix sp.]